jgi:ParB-like chromosome segregation protein Spo0J
MLLNLNKLPKINVLQYKDEMVIFDGHHRLTAMYLLGIKNIKANLTIL